MGIVDEGFANDDLAGKGNTTEGVECNTGDESGDSPREKHDGEGHDDATAL